MKTILTGCVRTAIAFTLGLALVPLTELRAQDWPQWRGVNREAHATGFKAPATWPAELTRTWSVTVGEGVSTPVLVGDRLIVFTRQDGNEIIRCLGAADGQERWQARYEALGATGPAQGFSGPRSSPVVAGGKVVTLGIRGVISCMDLESGKMGWRRDDLAGSWPRFFTASSPMIVDGLCIAQVGSEDKGGVLAYDLATGEPRWKWTDEGSAYASPVLAMVGGVKVAVTLTSRSIVALGVADGKLRWQAPFAPQGRAYNAATPIVDGSTVIYAGSGRGTKAIRLATKGEAIEGQELWANPDHAVQFNTPVLKDGVLYGISQAGDLYAQSAGDGKFLWTQAVGGRGFGSVVDGGTVLAALTPQADLVIFEPGSAFKQVASYKVGTDTYAYPVPSSRGIYVKDKDSVTLWSAP